MDIHERKGEPILTSFAASVGAKIENGRVDIPRQYGTGYVFGYRLDHRIRLIIRKYELKDDVVIKRGDHSTTANMIAVTIHNIIKENRKIDVSSKGAHQRLPSVVIATQGLDPEVHIPGHTSFNSIKLTVDASYLNELLGLKIKNEFLNAIIGNSQPLLFEEFVSLQLEQVVADMTNTTIEPALSHLFYKVKCEEIICYLLMELMQRQNNTMHALNLQDVRRIYLARERLLDDLSMPPTLPELARISNMSLSKLKRLFKQVYGKNMYAYYQDVRMKEAAYLLKNKGLSVSEVGYHLGFTNLSHFGRVFEKHTGLKPKKYSSAVNSSL